MNCIGIDLGTCLSSVAVIGENGKPTALRVDTGSSSLIGDSYSIPSSVFIEEDGTILLGQAADNSRMKNPARYRKEFKRDLGTDEPYHVGDMELFPEDLYKEFLKYFKLKAEEAIGKAVDKAVISHPANFAGHKKELIKKSALQAGFSEVKLIDEPTAAAVYYSSKEKIENGQKLLVYDLGGGTFDVSLIVKEEKGFRPLTPPLGIDKCGGVDFQRKIYEDILDTFSSRLNEIISKRDMASRQLSSMLEGESIKLKHQLSSANEAQAQILLPPLEFQTYKITRGSFENKIRELIDNTCLRVTEIVKNAGLKMNDIDKVILVGGSSRIPFIENMVKKTTGKPVSKDVDTELIVCYGAALYGNSSKPLDKEEKLKKKVKEEQRLYDEGIEHYKAGRYIDALDCFNRSLAFKPLMETYNYKGKTLDALKRYEEAVESYDKCIKLDTSFPYSYNNKGTALARLRKYREAIECYNMAIKLKPDYNLAKDNKKIAEEKLNVQPYDAAKERLANRRKYQEEGEKLFKEKKYYEALNKFNAAIEIEPSQILMNYKGMCLHEQRKYQEALKVYDSIITNYPKDPYVYNNKASTLEELGRLREALQCAEKAIAIKPNESTFISNRTILKDKISEKADELYNKADKCYKNKEHNEALNFINQALDIKTTAEAFNYKGVILDEMKSYEEAVKYYDKSIAINPGRSYIYNNKGVSMLNLKRYEEALQCFNKALDIDPSSKLASDNKNIVMKIINENKVAVNADQLYEKGVELYNSKKYSEALECFDKVVVLSPSADAYNYRGLVLRNLNRYDEALENYNKALEINPKYALVYNNIGAAYHNQGKYEEALKYYYKALDLEPDLQLALNNKKLALEKVKKSGSGCFLTTAVCELLGKEDNCYELKTLREFRDSVLLKNIEGKKLVEEYYSMAPEIAIRLKMNQEREALAKMLLDEYINNIIELINKKEKEAAIEAYKAMVYYVKAELEVN